jgi:membrane-bound inhibitor of C-type lysozyme
VICCSGSGYRGAPFVYWLPGREALLWPGDNACDEAKQSWRDRLGAHEPTPRGEATTG